jgi:hypothetical protein
VWPWLLTMLVFLGIVTYWEGLSTFLPRLLGMLIDKKAAGQPQKLRVHVPAFDERRYIYIASP